MNPLAGLAAELEQEAETTKRVLERIPADKLSWRPHEKSMSLGELALHTAMTPAMAAQLLAQDLDGVPPWEQAEAKSVEEVLAALESSVATAKQLLGSMDEATAMGEWRLLEDGKVLMAAPRLGMLRAIMLNHWYHHRGQLTVYLRLVGASVPVVYGRSADESMFDVLREAQPA